MSRKKKAEISKRPLPKRRLWLYRAIAAVGIPVLALLLLEIGLRLFGFGYPTSFLLRIRKDGTHYLTQNNRFGWRFFGRRMSRMPHPIYITEKKPSNCIRIFVFGESAAYGDPQPRFGLPRMLEALLELRHPGIRFEGYDPPCRMRKGMFSPAWTHFLGTRGAG